MAKKKIKPSKKGDILNSGPATYRQATPQEMTKHRETVKRDKKEKTHKYSSSNKRDKPKENKPIALNKPKEKTGISAYREKDTIGGKIVKSATSLKSVAVLGTVLAALTGGAAVAGAARAGAALASRTGQIAVTRTALTGTFSSVSLRTITGKAAHQSPKALNKIFHSVRPVAARYATNTKSTGLTNAFFRKAGFTNSAAKNIGVMIGTYPFAGFIKEEALQMLGFSASRSEDIGDVEGMENAANEMEEQLDYKAWEKVLFAIPYANITKEVADFLKAGVVALQGLRTRIEFRKNEETSGETQFQQERREGDEAARERQLANREEDKEYYDDIAKQREEDKAAGRTEDAAYYQKIAEENRARKLQEREEDEAYYAQFR